MPNLLPKKEKDILYAEYGEKLIVLSLLVFSALVIVAAVFLVPSYLLSISKLSAAESDLKLLKESVSYREGRNIEEQLRMLDAELESLNVSIDTHDLHMIFFEVLDDMPQGITLTALTLREMGQKGTEISIVGTASDRIGLISYANYLRLNPKFKKVDLPISNLAKEEDIVFDIKITL